MFHKIYEYLLRKEDVVGSKEKVDEKKISGRKL